MTGESFEDLIRELYECQGYLCLQDIPGKQRTAGGRDQYDLVAVRIEGKKVSEIVWIEATEYIGSAEGMKAKFTNVKEGDLREFLKTQYGMDTQGIPIHRKVYSKTEHPRLKRDGAIEVDLVSGEAIKEEIEKAVERYLEGYAKLIGREDSRGLTLPGRFSNLKMIYWPMKRIV